MIKTKFLCALTLLLGTTCLSALPSTDISIFELSKLFAKKEKNKEQFHLTFRDGYDNQPKFSKDGKKIFFTRGYQSDDSSQTEIYSYQFDNQQLTNVSKSLDSSEYSATPYQDEFLTIIGVADANGKQYLNRLSIATGEQKTFTTAIEPIGYHAWLNDKEAAVFVLGDVMTLQVLHTNANRKPIVLAENIGRCMQRIAENKISYTAEEQGNHRIYWLDENHESHDTGILLPKGVQDYVWLNDKEVIFGQDSKLYRMSAESTEEITDLASMNIKGISRLAIDKDNGRLAVVYER